MPGPGKSEDPPPSPTNGLHDENERSPHMCSPAHATYVGQLDRHSTGDKNLSTLVNAFGLMIAFVY